LTGFRFRILKNVSDGSGTNRHRPTGPFSFRLLSHARISVAKGGFFVLTENSVPELAGLFAGRWWTVILRGIVAIAFGILAFAWPAITLSTLVLLFGGYALVDGIFTLFAAIGHRRRENRWLLVLESVVSIWAGVVTLRSPALTAVVLVFFISIWAMATGVLRIVAAIHLRKEISGEVWLALSGVLSIFLALMLMLRPVIGALTLVWVIAGYALVLGIFEIMLGIELRRPHTVR
jgi:uncharacterized membrane protein HdeD (DUF308 family)